MNERIRKLVRTNTVAYILLLLLFAAVTAKISLALAIGEVAAALAVWYISHRRSKVVQQQLHQYVERIAGGADTAKNSNMLFAPMPMMVFNPENDDVLWANDLFTDLPGVGTWWRALRPTGSWRESRSSRVCLPGTDGATGYSAACPGPRERGIWACWPPPTGWM